MIEELKERCAKLGSAIGSIESEIVADRQKVDEVIGRISAVDDQELSDELDYLELKYESELAALQPKAKVKSKPAPKAEVK